MSQLQVNRINDASGGVLAPISSVMRNRIINGAMVIDQRNAGASVSVSTTSDVYTIDRWAAAGQSADGVFTVQQDTTVPAGFNKSMKITVTTADTSIGSSQYYLMQQMIEGFNVLDLGWGTANAKTITLSFWVRSSVTGTFGGSLRNASFDRNYPFTYTISAANTFEYKTITIAGDTSGTWATDNTTGIRITWSLGDGSSRLGTAGAWAAGNISGATGQTNLIATNGATFYLTGCQLEVGTQATSFEYRQYQQEFAMCQRYFYKLGGTGVNTRLGVGSYEDSTAVRGAIPFPVTMRAIPTGTASGNARFYTTAGRTYTMGLDADSVQMGSWTGTTTTSGTAGQSGFIDTSGFTSSFIQFSAEL